MIRAYWSLRTVLAWSLTAVAVVAFALTNGHFLNPGNLCALLQAFAVLGLIATGLAVVMIAGEFDLSIAGVVPLAALIAVKLGEHVGVPVGIAAAIATAVLVGLLNGYLTARFQIPSLAVTVGTLVLTTGVGFAIASNQVVTLSDFGVGLSLDQPILQIFSPRTLLQIVLAVLVIGVMSRTWLGLAAYGVGSDAARAKASGLSVTGTLVAVFALSGLFAGIAGSLQGVSLASGSAGPDEAVLLQAVTAAIIGGVSIAGGKGSIAGVLGGAMLLSVVSNGLSLQGTSTAVIQLINGAILLVVIALDGPLSRRIRSALETSSVVPAAVAEAGSDAPAPAGGVRP